VATVTNDDEVEGGRTRRVGSVILGLVIIAAKLFALRWLDHHGRVGISIVVGLAGLTFLRLGKPVRASVAFGIMAAVLSRPSSLGAGVEIAIAAIAALIVVSFAIGWVLNLLER
jgi:hypothetical protein